MESAKLDLKELLLATKIKNTNEKIKWVVISSFLFTLLVTTLAGITLFSRYLDRVINTKHEDIVVRLQMPDNKMPMPFMYPPAATWPLSLYEAPTIPKDVPEETKPIHTHAHAHLHAHKAKQKIKAFPNQAIAIENEHKILPAKQPPASAQPKAYKKMPNTIGKLTPSDAVPPGYIEIGKDLYFNPKLSRYLIRWKSP